MKNQSAQQYMDKVKFYLEEHHKKSPDKIIPIEVIEYNDKVARELLANQNLPNEEHNKLLKKLDEVSANNEFNEFIILDQDKLVIMIKDIDINQEEIPDMLNKLAKKLNEALKILARK